MQGDLGARLLQAGLVERADLVRALRHGGGTGSTLAVALVEGGLSEDALARYFLTEGFAPLLRGPDLASPPAEAVAAIDAALAHALFLLPVQITPETIRVAMVDPSDEHARAEIAFVTGRKVEAVLARLGDLRRAVETVYGAAPEPVMLLAKPRVDAEPAIPLVRPKAAPPQGPAVVVGGAVAIGGNQRVGAPEAAYASDKTAPPARAAPEGPPDENAWSSLPAAQPPSRGRELRGRTRPPPPITGPATSTPPAEGIGANVREAPRRRYGRARRAEDAPDVGPWLAKLRTVDDRDAAVRLACEAAAELGRAGVFLVLRRGVLRGWDAFGPEVSREAIANLWIPATSSSMFRDVIAEGRVFLGPVGTSAADQVYRAAIESHGGRTAIYPILVAGKPLGVLGVDEIGYADAGPARLGSIADAVASALERLVVEGKAKSLT